MLTKDGRQAGYNVLIGIYGPQWRRDRSKAFFTHLTPLCTDDELIAALDMHIANPETGTLPPTPAHITGQLATIRQRQHEARKHDRRAQMEAMADTAQPAPKVRCGKCRDTGTWTYWANPEDLTAGGAMTRYSEDDYSRIKAAEPERPLYRYLAPCLDCQTGRDKQWQVGTALQGWHDATRRG